MYRFSVNISTLFKEVPFLERFECVARCGFAAVEFWWPAAQDLPEIEAAISDSGLQVVLFNLDAGDMPAGDRGLLSDPARESAFAANLPVALELAQRLGCRQINALLGVHRSDLDPADQRELAIGNLRRAAAAAAQVDAKILVEAVNDLENGSYLVTRTADAARLIEEAGSPNLALQYDAYHMQRMEGNLADTIRRFAPQIAHVQIADCPGRAEPGTGEINFPFLFSVLGEIDYAGHIGLEYLPSTARAEDSLAWISAVSQTPGVRS